MIQAFAAAHRYGAGVGRIEHLSDRFLESPHVLALEGEIPAVAAEAIRRGDGRLIGSPELARYSTPELLSCEQRLVEGARARQGGGCWRR